MQTYRIWLKGTQTGLSDAGLNMAVRRAVVQCFAILFTISIGTAQNLLLIEPSIEGIIGYDFEIYPHCVNEHGHAAGVLVKHEQNRHIYYPFIWTPENGMILLPEPTTINDQESTYTVSVYGVRVLNLSEDGKMLLRLQTDTDPLLVGWSSSTSYRIIRSEYGDLFGTISCMPRGLLNSSWITQINSGFTCIGDGYYNDERHIYASEGNITIYPFRYDTMKFSLQGSYSVNLSNVFNFGSFVLTAISQDGRAVVGQILFSSLAHPFRAYLNEASQQWQGHILQPSSTSYGSVTAVSADGTWMGGHRRRPDNRYLPFVWYLWSGGGSFVSSVTDIDLPAEGGFVPNYGDVVDITSDGSMIVGNAQRREQGNIIDSKAYQWTSNRGVEYLETKYRYYIPAHFSFPFIIDMSSNGRYMLLQVAGSCAGYGVLDTLGEPMFPDNPTVVMRNETAPRDAPDVRHAYPFVGDTITLAAIVRYRGRYYFGSWACGTELSGRWFVPGHHFRSGGGEDTDFGFSHLRYTMPRIHEWSGPPLRFEWFRTRHQADLERQISSYYSTSRLIRVEVDRAIAQGAVYHRWYMYDEDIYLPPAGLWVRNINAQGPGTYRFYVRAPGGRRWVGLHQPKPGAWRDPSQDDDVFNDEFSFLVHRSQNCDEADELAIRISIRAVANWVDSDPDNRQRRFVEWASSFVNVAYEWGGWWYGGRADNQVQHSGARLRRIRDGRTVFYQGHASYEGYGIDCSGLVATAARLAGYRFDPWRMTATALEDTQRYNYCNPVNLADLKAGDLLVKGGRHVVIIYRINGVNHHRDGTVTIYLQILHAAGEPTEPRGGNDSLGHKVLIESVTITGRGDDDKVQTSGSGNTTGIDLTTYVARRLRE